MTGNLIEGLLTQLPLSPGVYIMRDVRGGILYVGKAVNLRNRVKSYFKSSSGHTPKTQKLVEHIHDFEFFVVSSEQEALILELNLIKRYRPPYNILLKDDKSFPYLKIKSDEEWPRLHITRRLEEDGSRYFGPFASIHSLRRTLDALKRIFPLRSCTRPIQPDRKRRPCLNYHIKQCLAPCAGNIDRPEYQKIIDQLVLFLEGKHVTVTRSLKKKMAEASALMEFETAARLRDQIQSIQDVIEGQSIAMKVRGEQDAIAFAGENDQGCAQVFMIRNGKLIGRESYTLKGTGNEDQRQILTSFVKQFYSASPYIPRLLLLQHPVYEKEVIEQWLSDKKGGSVIIESPRRGKKRQLMDIVAENARQGLEQLKIKQMSVPSTLAEALTGIQEHLKLSSYPSRIEGYDISNIQGTDAVGSMVVFAEGKPQISSYRRFKIKTVEGANDFAMLQEMLKRRFIRAVSGDSCSPSWKIMPDLVLIDGGKGQLNAALEVMRELSLDSVPLAGLAKENEELFLPGQSVPLVLPASKPELKLLQRVRDEAHRFAITYFQNVHKKRTFASALDDINGIGPKKKKSLIRHFGSVQNIRQSSVEELSSVKGIDRNLAIRIKESL
ncbi:MAG: excinuclease ABC subunit UvrC [Dehalococcoidales bacterium]|nr:excinuclease ABC subunit UvrC [Dehalococcoidales bacterium]